MQTAAHSMKAESARPTTTTLWGSMTKRGPRGTASGSELCVPNAAHPHRITMMQVNDDNDNYDDDDDDDDDDDGGGGGGGCGGGGGGDDDDDMMMTKRGPRGKASGSELCVPNATCPHRITMLRVRDDVDDDDDDDDDKK